jgi:hypothetical protein
MILFLYTDGMLKLVAFFVKKSNLISGMGLNIPYGLRKGKAMSSDEMKHCEIKLSPEVEEKLRAQSRRYQMEFLGVGFLLMVILFFLFGGKL